MGGVYTFTLAVSMTFRPPRREQLKPTICLRDTSRYDQLNFCPSLQDPEYHHEAKAIGEIFRFKNLGNCGSDGFHLGSTLEGSADFPVAGHFRAGSLVGNL